jgi:predicted RNase H-like HicB family nuclease
MRNVALADDGISSARKAAALPQAGGCGCGPRGKGAFSFGRFREERLKLTLHIMLKIEVEREEDGRWLAEAPALPGVLSYGTTEAEARARVISLALRVIADRIDNGEPLPEEARDLFAA